MSRLSDRIHTRVCLALIFAGAAALVLIATLGGPHA